MKVLVIGGGGRCHAIVDALGRSPRVTKIWCAPGNAGIARQAECVPLRDTDVEGLLAFARREGADLTVVGPESALAAGIVDAFRAAGLRIFGPTQAAARIETSKRFAKELMLRYAVPTAAYRVFSDYGEAADYVRSQPLPAVLKYDGLAAGKGVVIARTPGEADAALRDMLLDDRFGHGQVVVEEFMEGPEFSLMCFVAGRRVVPMALAQDHKRAYDGDRGPNTGGMGACSPLPFITPEEERWAVEHVMQPVADALADEGCPFTGVLYGGLMRTRDGIRVVEFNARFGDPETEVVLPRLESDFFEACMAVAEGREPGRSGGATRRRSASCWPARGIRAPVRRGRRSAARRIPARWFTTWGQPCAMGRLVTAGGRVLIVVGRGATLAEARDRALEAAGRIGCDRLFYRRDIGAQALGGKKLLPLRETD